MLKLQLERSEDHINYLGGENVNPCNRQHLSQTAFKIWKQQWRIATMKRRLKIFCEKSTGQLINREVRCLSKKCHLLRDYCLQILNNSRKINESWFKKASLFHKKVYRCKKKLAHHQQISPK